MKYKVLIIREAPDHCKQMIGMFADTYMLSRGLYTTNSPHLFHMDTTIEGLIRLGCDHPDYRETDSENIRELILDQRVKNLRKCELKVIELTFV